jgi:hypothetical protein
MNNEDLKSFIKAFGDFMEHYEVEELYYEGRKVHENTLSETKNKMMEDIEREANRLEITCDYYIAEFM